MLISIQFLSYNLVFFSMLFFDIKLYAIAYILATRTLRVTCLHFIESKSILALLVVLIKQVI